jgi:hypothetical protein
MLAATSNPRREAGSGSIRKYVVAARPCSSVSKEPGQVFPLVVVLETTTYPECYLFLEVASCLCYA